MPSSRSTICQLLSQPSNIALCSIPRRDRTITTALRPDAAPFQHPGRGHTTPHGYTERCEEQSRADDAACNRPEAYPDRSQPNLPCVHDTHQHHDEHSYGSGKGDALWNVFKHLNYLESVT